MNAEKLKAFLQSRGYTNIVIKVESTEFSISCNSPECHIEHHYKFSISELPNNANNSERCIQLMKTFPTVYGKILL
jgi:hypothetical protein